MYFKFRKDAQNWFDKLGGKQPKHPFSTQFDFYYCCAMAGLSAGRHSAPPEGWSSTSDLVDYFPEDYKPQRHMIVALLVRSELNRLGVDVSEKDEVQRQLEQLIDPESPSKISDQGVTLLNEYASGGFEYLVERMGPKPESADDFLLTLLEEIEQAVGSD